LLANGAQEQKRQRGERRQRGPYLEKGESKIQSVEDEEGEGLREHRSFAKGEGPREVREQSPQRQAEEDERRGSGEPANACWAVTNTYENPSAVGRPAIPEETNGQQRGRVPERMEVRR
jgi:hypothetical protein